VAATAFHGSDATGPSATAQSDQVVVAPGGPVFTPRFPARSSYAPNGIYHADVIRVALEGTTLVVTIEASGNADLRQPQTSCVQVVDAKGTQIASLPVVTFVSSLSQPDHYLGDLKFDATKLPVGDYFLRYSCAPDYSAANIGTVTGG
jgi:hypothetical protein